MFRINEETAELFIYDSIGPSWAGMIDDVLIVDALATLQGRKVTARINSEGGDVFIASSIYNALQRHDGGVDTTNDGLAASAASFIFLAGENRTVAKNATFMSHLPWTIALGDATEMRKTADILDKIGGTMAETYADRMEISVQAATEMLAAETWHNAAEGIEAKLATAVGDGVVSDSQAASSVASFKAGATRKRVEEIQRGESPPQVAAKLRAKLTGIV